MLWGGGMPEGQRDMDAGEGIRSGCSSQKQMPRETKDRVKGRTVKIVKKRIGSDSCILWETHLVKIAQPHLRVPSTSSIWRNPLARRNHIHHIQVIHCARILSSTQVEGRDSRQNTKRRIVLEENDKLLKMRKFKKRSNFAFRIELSDANVSTNYLS